MDIDTGISVDTYFEIDAASETPVEYWGGEAVVLPGETFPHLKLKKRVVRLLDDALPLCETYPSGLRVEAPDLGRANYAYPDVVTLCEESQFDESTRPHTLLNPTLLGEVLSSSTRAYDLDQKLTAYLQIPSLMAYVIVDPQTPRVRIYHRTGDGVRMEEVQGLDAVASVPSLNLALSLRALYEDILPAS